MPEWAYSTTTLPNAKKEHSVHNRPKYEQIHDQLSLYTFGTTLCAVYQPAKSRSMPRFVVCLFFILWQVWLHCHCDIAFVCCLQHCALLANCQARTVLPSWALVRSSGRKCIAAAVVKNKCRYFSLSDRCSISLAARKCCHHKVNRKIVMSACFINKKKPFKFKVPILPINKLKK